MSGVTLAASCARGIDLPLDPEAVGGSAGFGGTFIVSMVATGGVAGSPTGSGGAGTSSGGAGAGTVGAGASGGAAGTGASGAAGSSSTGGAGGAGGDAGASGSSGAAGQGGSAMDASVVDAFDASAPKDAPPEMAPCPGAGTALSFDGSKSQYVLVPGAALPSGAAPRTIEIWVLNKSPIANWAPDHTVWEQAGGGSLATFAMDFDNVATPRQMELYVNPAANSFFFDTGMMQDRWFHLAASFDGTKTHAFVNGVEIGTGLTITGTLATAANQPLYVGSAKLRNYFTGSVDEVRIWNIARTQADIARDMGFRLVGNEPGLVGYYRFDEGSGTTARDATSGGNNGTLTNGPTYAASGVTLRCR